MDILSRVLSDIFDIKIIKYAFAPLLLSLIFWGVVFYFFSGNIVDWLHSYVSMLPFGDTLNNWITGIGAGIILLFLFYELVILSLGIFSSFFVDKITTAINDKYYRLPTKKVSLLEGIWVSVKSIFIFIVVFMFTFMFFFIPVINIFYQVFLWAVINKKPLVFDSTALFCDYKQFEKENNIKLWSIVYLTSFIYFVPIVSLFGYTIQLIVMTHVSLSECSGENQHKPR